MNTAAARAVQAAHELIEKVSAPTKSEEMNSLNTPSGMLELRSCTIGKSWECIY